MKKLRSLEELKKWREQILVSRSEKSKKILKTVVLSSGTCGQASGSLEVLEAFKKEIEARHLEEKIELKVTGCHGFCEMEPNIIIEPDKIFYKQLKPKDVPVIIERTLLGGEIIPELVYQDPLDGRLYPYQPEIPFYRRQLRWLTEANFYLDPTSLEDYIAHGGYEALARVLQSFEPERVIEEITASGLRGRGGAGFPTGRKWKICREAPGDLKFIICNADEGDPGAYMDRSLLEGNPHSVLEGMIIGAYAIGAREGFVYVRMEYPLAVRHVTLAIEQAREAGLLGEAILGSSFSFDLHIVQGAGAFVSGEETSLMASIEGRRAFPRQRPPFPAQSGLWGYPTNINNVETWANIPLIIKKGASWFNQVGTEGSKGTKIFSLVGKINNTGLVEVPMGITLREIIYEVGGGIKGGRSFKAVQTGGPSGGCLPSSLLDLPVDYDTLTRAGSIMGSGGMIVMDEATCMVDVARYFLNFTQEESCGKCVPCRIGTRQMVDILNRIVAGQGEEGDMEKLESLAQTVKKASLCGLGQTAPNPVLTTLKYFREEYEAHIREKSCPALVCKDLIVYYIEPELCVGCLLCLKSCPSGAISGERKKPHYIDQSLCIKCGACFEKCPKKVQAIKKYTGKKRDEILAASRAIKNSRVGL
jgi:NADH:ubiquinone oxidoreductase subunit F (NADH-binding)/(2Fe-2S) ferredoxin/Pyruvate/2-oxoacid:ferredoxin oxidoreductase delta subunit